MRMDAPVRHDPMRRPVGHHRNTDCPIPPCRIGAATAPKGPPSRIRRALATPPAWLWISTGGAASIAHRALPAGDRPAGDRPAADRIIAAILPVQTHLAPPGAALVWP